MKKFLLSCCLVLLSMSAYADIHRVDANLFSSTQGVCYGTSLNDTYYTCERFYVCGNNPTKCSGGGGCQPRCDGIPDYVWAYGNQRSGYISLKNGDNFTHNNKNYFCCLPSGKSWGSFVQKDLWQTTEKKQKPLGGGGRCYYDVTTDACGNVTQGDCNIPTECVGNTVLRNNECIVPCKEYESETSNKCKETPKPQECTGGMVLRNNECIVPCKEYESETSNKCKEAPKPQECTGGMVLRNNECIVPCDEYESETSNKCKQITSCNSETEIYDSVKGRCANKSDYISVSRENMEKCFACSDNRYFKLCAFYKCYEENSNNMCNNVGKYCLLDNN